MDQGTPTITVDERGIWLRGSSGGGHGIEWDEIHRVVGAKVDGVTERFPCLVIDFAFGHFVELYADWPGFPNAVAALTTRLDLTPNWFDAVNAMSPGDDPIVFWTRP